MPDGHEPGYQSLIAAAESAAAAGDLHRTESLFREAVRAQEQELGPAHPGLASTCNNLAVVCERAGHYDDAEYYYRRAHAIAVSLLDPKDPSVQTSFDNLREFCQARGLSLDDWPEIAARPNHEPPLRGRPASLSTVPRPRSATPPSPAVQRVTARSEAPDADVADLFGVYSTAAPSGESTTSRQPSLTPGAATGVPASVANAPAPPISAPPIPAPRPPARLPSPPVPAAPAPFAAPFGSQARRPARRHLATAAVAAAIAATTALAWWALPSDTATVSGAGPAARVSLAPAPSAPVSSPPTPPVLPAAPDASATLPDIESGRPATASPPPAPTAVAPAREPRDARKSAAAAPAVGLRVVTTGVCTTLDTRASPWRCAAVGDATPAGPITYYTRIANPQARTRVEHRWYQDDVLRLTRSLPLAYSPTEGYRTYSRYTPTPGRWRVALVAPDGTVLHDARFEVR